MSEPVTDQQTPNQGMRFLPKAAWAGLIIGVVGFALSIGTTSTEKVNGKVTQCSVFDIGAFGVALVVLACLIMTWQQRAGMHRVHRPAGALMAVVTVALGALVVAQVLRGLGIIMSPC